ncbi:MAG: FliM/FliN family flagellar motor switch protein [Solirubrobacteraceae bacterium]|nr:FliM/FliN family flagellar motor switch protein [Solirubrobacteraceae bacterium]
MRATDRVLRELGMSTAEAAAAALEVYVPEGVVVGDPEILDTDAHPLTGVAFPAVATAVQYVDGVTGGNVFVTTPAGARRLALAMLGADPADELDHLELDEMEASAVGEAMNQMMAAAAAATSRVLGTEVEIGPPDTLSLESPLDADGRYELAPFVTGTPISVLGEPGRLVQLVPNAFVVRMTRALEDQGAQIDTAAEGADDTAPVAAGDALREVGVDVWVELGRTTMPAGELVAVPSGGVIALDRMADDPVDLYAGGLRIGTGRLVVVDGSEWAVRIESLTGVPDEPSADLPTPSTTTTGGT